jgi:hypothetical protein
MNKYNSANISAKIGKDILGYNKSGAQNSFEANKTYDL